ncbi:hypothetical protein LTR04_006599 [Oleoguttula sp. CCFEE 6159]|nr:hypothetical protein LTR04_006599 [Oleoguttula sp. CCFEE 6159]
MFGDQGSRLVAEDSPCLAFILVVNLKSTASLWKPTAMAATLGKRKRDALNLGVERAPPPEHEIANELPKPEEEDEDSDWEGMESNNGEIVEVIEHSASDNLRDRATKEEMKAFMSSKPPSTTAKTTSTAKQKTASMEEDSSEAANLKNDLALQRLLKESHLLDPSSSFSPSGMNRHKATDLRLRSLGSKASIMTQEKMPLSHRKGIIAKASEKEEKRRREAKENGIVLEKVAMKRSAEGKRERGVGGPAVGKFRGGTLKLSKRDVASIEGPKRGGAKGKRGGR